ncbi:hypothetical protein PanWU01x14_187520 [Parasponia andersonii]|uniref:Transmembrane protein n=1 Tax=Parasponia andersonii TaxID=3476 RepID=A0A2P5C3D7_PARAD|nr:hypothetical protein PanWU01x14_187520 [Parasponia andersonii]
MSPKSSFSGLRYLLLIILLTSVFALHQYLVPTDADDLKMRKLLAVLPSPPPAPVRNPTDHQHH